ncbi:astacin [Ancylostoma ceylanicum]|uniref:Astacin n=1 Tax=Ancylostoma ceylanicum TaxID=53326 RepID=A0A0D6LSU2_9BILA|nr:astacin [Ancylostoma ceylanicum]
MAWILATFLYIVWSSEFCRCEEVLSTEQSIAQAQQSNNEMEHSENQVNNSNHHKWSNGVYYIFEPGANDGYGYLNVTDKYDYKSDIGRLGNEQIFSIGKKCDEEIGRAIRELGQVLGLYLTKDSHVAVMPEGMNKSALDELEGISQKGSDLSGKNHDYGSIIRSGSPAEKQNLADWNYRKTIGSHMISFMDLWLVNEYYGCHGNVFHYDIFLHLAYFHSITSERILMRYLCITKSGLVVTPLKTL